MNEGFLQLIGYIEKKDRFAFIFKGYDVNKWCCVTWIQWLRLCLDLTQVGLCPNWVRTSADLEKSSRQRKCKSPQSQPSGKPFQWLHTPRTSFECFRDWFLGYFCLFTGSTELFRGKLKRPCPNSTSQLKKSPFLLKTSKLRQLYCTIKLSRSELPNIYYKFIKYSASTFYEGPFHVRRLSISKIVTREAIEI